MIIITEKEASFLERYRLRNIIILPMQFPFSIRHHENEVNEVLSGIEVISDKKRKLLFHTETKLEKDQNIVPHISSDFLSVRLHLDQPVFDYNVSRLFCAIEIYDDEIDFIKSKKDNSDYVENLIQRVLEIFFYKYNINNIGIDFHNPNSKLIAPVQYGVSTNDGRINKTEPPGGLLLIYPSISSNVLRLNINGKELPKENWVYFFSDAINEYKYFNYFDAIINSAISFEAYMHYIVRVNKLSEIYLYKKNGDFLSITATTLKLYNDGHLRKNNLSQSDLNDVLTKVMKTRNQIIHGANIEIYDLKKQAKSSVLKLYDFYKTQNLFNK